MNTIVILNIDSPKSKIQPEFYSEPCIKSWEKYCEKYDVNLLVVNKLDKTLPHPKWQKTKIFEYAYASDRVLYVDADTIVSNKCPNVFDQVEPYKIGAVKDNWNLFWLNSTIKTYQPFFSDIELDIDNYINSGVMLFTRKYHQAPLQEIHDWVLETKGLEEARLTPNSGCDQTCLNFWFQKRGLPIEFLDHRYNQYGFSKFDLLESNWQRNDQVNHFLKTGFIYHLTGLPVQDRKELMKAIYHIEYGN